MLHAKNELFAGWALLDVFAQQKLRGGTDPVGGGEGPSSGSSAPPPPPLGD